MLLAQANRLLEEFQVELGGLDAVVVARHGVGDQVGIAVRVHDGHHGDAHLGSVDQHAVIVVPTMRID